MTVEKIIYDVYMMGAISGEDGPKTSYLRVNLGGLIQGLGHNLLTPHVAYDHLNIDFRKKVGGPTGVSLANETLMDKATLFIAEGSGASDGRGYEIRYGLDREVPTLVFRHYKFNPGTAMIFGKNHPLLYCATYDLNTLESLLKDAIERVPRMIKNYHNWKLPF